MKKSDRTYVGGLILVLVLGVAGIATSSQHINMAYLGLGLGATLSILLALSRIEAAIRKED